jgi:hypothetical protein
MRGISRGSEIATLGGTGGELARTRNALGLNHLRHQFARVRHFATGSTRECPRAFFPAAKARARWRRPDPFGRHNAKPLSE